MKRMSCLMGVMVSLALVSPSFAEEGEEGMMTGKSEMMTLCPEMMKDMAGMMQKCAPIRKDPMMMKKCQEMMRKSDEMMDQCRGMMEKSEQMMKQCPMMKNGAMMGQQEREETPEESSAHKGHH